MVLIFYNFISHGAPFMRFTFTHTLSTCTIFLQFSVQAETSKSSNPHIVHPHEYDPFHIFNLIVTS